jgi:hypothetical protein
MNPQIPWRQFGVAADRQRRVALFRHAPNASLFAGGTLAIRRTANPESAPSPIRAGNEFGFDISSTAQKCCFQRHLISPGINTYKNSYSPCIQMIPKDFNPTRNNSSGSKDLKSIRINTSGCKYLKSFRINTYKKYGRGVGQPRFLVSLRIAANHPQGLFLPRTKPFASLGDSPLNEATA